MTPCSAGSTCCAGNQSKVTEHDQEAGAGERKAGCECDDAARGGERGLQRHDDEPDRGKGFDAAGEHRHHHDGAGKRQRRQHMRAFIAAGARQEPGQQDRRDQPGKGRDFQRARRAAQCKVNRKGRERRQAADQPRRDEGAMTRSGQRVVARRRMQQRIETVADGTQNTHGTRASALIVNKDAPQRLLYLSPTVSEWN